MPLKKGATPAADLAAHERRQRTTIEDASFASPDQQLQCTAPPQAVYLPN
jgi:hypothetical protein